jgi:class I lanthipeptide synthase
MTSQHPARSLAEAVAARLADPSAVPGGWPSQTWWRQSLAHGVPGIALLHIECAATGLSSWQQAHDWLGYITSSPVTSGPGSHLFYGAPAVAHALTCATVTRPGSCQRALRILDAAITATTRCRVAAAHARIDQGRLPVLAEFDLIRGLAGAGAYLLRRDPAGRAAHAVLEYMVRLTEPVTFGGETLPGWWAASGPSGRPDERFPGGHANCGMAHGIGGPLALLSLAALKGVTVPGHFPAIASICTWLDHWRASTDAAWPYWVTRAELRTGRVSDRRPARPSWCYGTAGLARAQQLASLATGDATRRCTAEDTLIHALTDPSQRAATTDSSLCHGYAGLAHLATQAAANATPAAATRLRALIPGLVDAVHPPGTDPRRTTARLLDPANGGPSLLEGAAGTALVALSASTGISPSSGWDTCLLIT